MIFNSNNLSTSGFGIGNDGFLVNRFNGERIDNTHWSTSFGQFFSCLHNMDQGNATTNQQQLIFVTLFHNLQENKKNVIGIPDIIQYVGHYWGTYGGTGELMVVLEEHSSERNRKCSVLRRQSRDTNRNIKRLMYCRYA